MREKHEAEVKFHSKSLLEYETMMKNVKLQIEEAEKLKTGSYDADGAYNNDEELGHFQSEVVKCKAAVNEAETVWTSAEAALATLKKEDKFGGWKEFLRVGIDVPGEGELNEDFTTKEQNNQNLKHETSSSFVESPENLTVVQTEEVPIQQEQNTLKGVKQKCIQQWNEWKKQINEIEASIEKSVENEDGPTLVTSHMGRSFFIG